MNHVQKTYFCEYQKGSNISKKIFSNNLILYYFLLRKTLLGKIHHHFWAYRKLTKNYVKTWNLRSFFDKKSRLRWKSKFFLDMNKTMRIIFDREWERLSSKGLRLFIFLSKPCKTRTIHYRSIDWIDSLFDSDLRIFSQKWKLTEFQRDLRALIFYFL